MNYSVSKDKERWSGVFPDSPEFHIQPVLFQNHQNKPLSEKKTGTFPLLLVYLLGGEVIWEHALQMHFICCCLFRWALDSCPSEYCCLGLGLFFFLIFFFSFSLDKKPFAKSHLDLTHWENSLNLYMEEGKVATDAARSSIKHIRQRQQLKQYQFWWFPFSMLLLLNTHNAFKRYVH